MNITGMGRPETLKVYEIAQLLGIGPTRIYKYIHDGELVPVQKPGVVRVPVTEVEILVGGPITDAELFDACDKTARAHRAKQRLYPYGVPSWQALALL